MMDYEAEQTIITDADPCYDWPFGQCLHGSECARIHHGNLDPTLSMTREHSEYMVSNATGEACQRCLQAARQCDKKGRSGDDDPCSECRWFGGESCRCRIAADTSYNDQLWGVMMTRRNADYTLPAPKSREVGRPDRAPPSPMPDAKVKADWKGETRDQLLAKADMLPAFVRELPRAYLVPPRLSAKRKKSAAFKQSGSKRKFDALEVSSPTISTEPISFAALPAVPPPPPFTRPSPDPQHGEVVASTWSWIARVWEHTYASGGKFVCSQQSAMDSVPAWYSKHAGPQSTFVTQHGLDPRPQPRATSNKRQHAIRPQPDAQQQSRKKLHTQQQDSASPAVDAQQDMSTAMDVEPNGPSQTDADDSDGYVSDDE